MTSDQNQFEELFPEAYRNFEVEQLFADLAKALIKDDLEDNQKIALLGKICGYTGQKTAELTKYDDDGLRTGLSDHVYRAVRILLELEERTPWKKAYLLQILEKYRKQSQKSLNIEIFRICEQLRDRCSELLQHQKGLSTNSLMSRDGVTFEVDDLFVSLGLEEHKKPAKQKDISSTEQGSIFYAPYEQENKKRFKDREFFEEVIRQCKTPKSQGQRIVIIGEPGAGKTTLLQKIGDELQKNKTIPIWISLSRVASKPLSKYLLEDWLRDAAQALETAPAEWKTALEELLKTGQVCLLLDGADEMIVGANERTPLLDIGCQLREGWAKKVGVILTCRLNVWENNALEEFDVYRTLNFDYPTQVEQFIDNFFNRQSVDSQLANDLKAELQLETKARIRDLVKNPLRLSLLCYAWELGIGSLPDTKAELYELFVQVFYRLHELKDSKLKVPFEKQEELKKALGNLSKEALDSKNFRFLLPQSFIERFLGNANDEKSLFWLAIKQLSWLNCVGRIAEKPFENAYAFFHPTFQEYFAALAIDDWHFFLNHVPENLRQGVYRIFESQWREVILLWLGQEDILKTQKHDFILSLLKFKDKCWNFYGYQALLLAALGIAEFRDCICADLIISELVWLESTTSSIGDEEDSIHGIIMTVLRVLRDTHSSILIEQLAKLRSHDDIEKFYVGSNNQEAVAALTNMLYDAKDEIEVLEIAKSLAKVNPGNQNAIDVFIKFLRNNQSSVVEIIKNSNTFQTINKFCEQYFELIINLHKYGVKGNREIGNILIELINHLPYCWNLLLTVETVGEICITIPEVIAILTKLLQDNQEETLQRTTNITLQKRFNLNSKSISLEQEEKNKFTRFVDQSIIDKMIWLYENPENMDRVQLTVAWLETIVIEQKFFFFLNSSPKGYKFIPQVSEIIAALQLMQTNCKYDIFYEKIEECLQEIVPDIVDFNLVLMNILNTWDKHIIWYISNKNVRMCSINRNTDIDTVKHLKLILKGELSILAKTLQHSFINSAEYSQELQQWLQGEIFHTDSLEGLNSEIEFHDWLEKWDTNYGSDIHIRYFCYSLLWQYAQNMSYPDFYDAWHKSTTTPTHPEAPDNIPVGKSSITQNLNFTQLPSILDSAIANDEELNKAVKLICIDINNEFSNPDMCAAYIYSQMVNQGCPECPQGRPTTMPLLNIYWQVDLDSGKLEKRVALLFYNSKNDRTLNPSFLSDISTFGGTIAIISDEHCNNVRLIYPNDSNFIDTVLKWLKREIKEA